MADVVDINRDSWSPGDEEETIRYLDLTAVLAPGSVAEPLKLVSAAAPSRARRRVHSGDILVSTVRPNLRGFARITGASSNLIASTGFAVLSPRRSTISAYIYHHVMTPGFAAYLENATTGQAYPAVRPADVASYRLNLPPLSEQRAIAAVLDSIDEAIERAEEVIAATERLRDALLHELLARGLPGQHSEWKEVPGLGPIPASWQVVHLGDVCRINRCSWSPGSEAEIIHYLDLSAVVAPGVVAGPREINSDMAPSRARRRVASGDILVSTVRPNLRGFARIMEAPANLIASTGFAVLSAWHGVSGTYAYQHVMSAPFASHLEKATTGQAYPAVRPDDVASYRLGLPPPEEQTAIAAVLDSVDASIERAREERAVLSVAATSVADALLTGRLRADQRRK